MTDTLKKEFYFVRHAESLVNIGVGGNFESPLTPLGHAQASKCAEHFAGICGREALVLSSPFLRCVATAEKICAETGAGLMLEPALHEHFRIEWFPRGVKFPLLGKIASEHPMVRGHYANFEWWPDRNENEDGLNLRARLFCNRLLGPEFDAEKIICVSHMAVIIAAIGSLAENSATTGISNAGVSKLIYDGKKCSVEFVNNTSFLDEK